MALSEKDRSLKDVSPFLMENGKKKKVVQNRQKPMMLLVSSLEPTSLN